MTGACVRHPEIYFIEEGEILIPKANLSDEISEKAQAYCKAADQESGPVGDGSSIEPEPGMRVWAYNSKSKVSVSVGELVANDNPYQDDCWSIVKKTDPVLTGSGIATSMDGKNYNSVLNYHESGRPTKIKIPLSRSLSPKISSWIKEKISNEKNKSGTLNVAIYPSDGAIKDLIISVGWSQGEGVSSQHHAFLGLYNSSNDKIEEFYGPDLDCKGPVVAVTDLDLDQKPEISTRLTNAEEEIFPSFAICELNNEKFISYR